MTILSRRAGLIGAASAALLPNVVRAQAAWPTPTITLIVPFPPGGSTDTVARLAQPGLQQRLGVPVIVENRGGASGSIGAGLAAKAKPDGGTWLVVFDTHAVNATLYPNLPFNTEKDLDPVMLIGTAPHVIVTPKAKPYQSWQDVLAAAKAKDGGLNYGTIGTGSIGHLTMLALSKRSGVPFTHVAFRGGGPLLNDTVAGHVDLSIASTGLLGPQLAAGAIRPLLQTGAKRLASLKDVPTAIEAGFSGFTSLAWWGVFAPAGVPKEVQARFLAALTDTLKEEKAMRQLTETQQIDVQLAGPDVLRPFLSEQIKLWGSVVTEAGIKPGN